MTVQDIINITLATQTIEIYEEVFCEIMYIGDNSKVPDKYRNCSVLCLEVMPSMTLRLYIS